MTGCGSDSSSDSESLDVTAPTITLTIPAADLTGVVRNANIFAIFSEEMDPATITGVTFTLKQGGTPVAGAVSYTGRAATFNPTVDLTSTVLYTATITVGVKDLSGNALAVEKTWSFTTGTAITSNPAVVDLLTAGNFVILAKSAISTTGTTSITGDLGLSPAAATYITGFGLVMDASNVFSTSSLVTGNLYAANYAAPTPANMTTAISDMEAAYTAAAGRTLPDFTELGAGDISGLTLPRGLYKWGTGLLISTDIYLDGSATDVWIFQIGEGLTVASGARIHLTGGALAKNVFWQSFGAVTLGTTSHMEGVILTYTNVSMSTGATANSRLLAQTAVTMDANTVVEPAP
ncbi:MAG: hypothetical protein CVV49_16460 [Spirochaetae bacterium HGW-Spirochaetae-5]|nr:MAG: hypothetical protein CVV49_16460 [Spirochaetae bacterium HGW-Spirochaetae-5]